MATTKDAGFPEWAFGKRAWIAFLQHDLNVLDLMYLWNQKHGDKHTIMADDIIQDSISKMEEIWNKLGRPND